MRAALSRFLLLHTGLHEHADTMYGVLSVRILRHHLQCNLRKRALYLLQCTLRDLLVVFVMFVQHKNVR